MSSLLQSIFGETKAGASTASSPHDAAQEELFATTIQVPKPRLVDPTSSSKKKRKAAPTTEAVDSSTNVVVEEQVGENAPLPDDEGTPGGMPNKNDDDCTIFVGNLPITMTRKSLMALFARCGTVASARIRSVATTGVQLPPSSAGNQKLVKKVCTHTHKIDATMKNSVHAYVVFRDSASVAVAVETMNNYVVDDEHVMRVDTATPTVDPQRSVFVGNLPYASQEESLRLHFVTHMPSLTTTSGIQGVRIVRDKDTFQCRGFGYVLFADKSLVAEALQRVPGTTYLKKELRVLVCGKRFKGKQGKYTSAENAKRRKLPPRERVGESTGALKRILTKQIVDGASKSSDVNKRKRGDKKAVVGGKAPHHKAGVSKRQASMAKTGKREKTIQKRMATGMGKNKKGPKA